MNSTFEERAHGSHHTKGEEKFEYLELLLVLVRQSTAQLALLRQIVHLLTPPQASLAYFVISPKGGTMIPVQQALPALTAGSTLQLVATGYDKDGNVDAVPADNSLAWGVSDSTLATIDTTGKLTVLGTAAAGSKLSVTVGLAKPLADGTAPVGAADQPIVPGEIASFIIAAA